MKRYRSFINNEFIDNENLVKIEDVNDGTIIGSIPSLSKIEIDKAYESALEGFNSWSKVSLEKRIDFMNIMKNILIDNADELADIMVREIAKNKKDSRTEIIRSAEYIDDTINSYIDMTKNPLSFTSEELKIKTKTAKYILQPLGVILAIPPFNYPINLLVSKIAPAIISGNSIVIKPPTAGSIVTCRFIELLSEKNIPNGLINLITGRGKDIGDDLVINKNISMISFTGSSGVGKHIAKKINLIPIVLELGGKDPAIVLEDADIDLTVKEIIAGAFSYSGQRCTAIKRVLAHESINDILIEKLKVEIDKLIVDYSTNEKANITPLINQKSLDFNLSLLEDAKNNGAILHNDIKYENRLLSPVLISNVNLNAKVAWEEQFGPILPIIKFKDISEAIDIANKSNLGLQASIFTKNLDLAEDIAIKIETGTVNINKSSSRGPDILPFFGIKDSGFGIQGIKYAILSMNRLKGIVNNK